MNRFTDLILNCLLLFLGLLFFFYYSLGNRLWNLNDVQLDRSGDGLKNYYTFAFQYKYLDDWNFSGFLYPFGDLTVYADSQIALVDFLRFLKPLGIDLSENILFVINFLPLLSFFVGGLFLILILKEYGVDRKYLGITALFCMALSPQVWRIQSHFALGYACIIPIAWYLFIRLKQAKSNSNRLWISLLTTFIFLIFGYLHIYHLIGIGLFFSILSLFYLRTDLKLAIYGWVIAFLPIIAFLIISAILDPSVDRPKNPYGIWAFRTTVRDLFPFFGIIGSTIDSLIAERNIYTEGYCYPSLLPFLLILAYLFKSIIGGRMWQPQVFKELSQDLKYALYAGLVALFFSMGLHLVFTNGLILEWIPHLKQFRGLGRFSWIFYYTAFIFFAILFWKLVSREASKLIKGVYIVVLVTVWFVESLSYHKSFSNNIENYSSENLLKEEKSIANMLHGHHVPSDFQAMLTLPPSAEGAEKFNLVDHYFLKTATLPFSYQTGMPMTSCIMSRTSISKILKILQLSSSAYGQRIITTEDLSNDKLILIVVVNDFIDLFDDLLVRGYFINSNEHLSLYAISPIDLLERKKYELDSNSIDLTQIDAIYKNDTLLFFEEFEDYPNVGMSGFGSYYCKNGPEVVADIPLNPMVDQVIDLSFWNKILPDKSTVPTFEFLIFDSSDNVIQRDEFRDWDLNRVEVYDDWVRYKRSYTIDSIVRRVKLVVHGKHQYLDKLLIKSSDVTVHKIIDSKEAYADHLMVELAK